MTLVFTHTGGHHLRQQELLNKSASSEKAISRLYLEMVLLSLSFLSLNIINAFSPTDVNNPGVMRTIYTTIFFVSVSAGELWSKTGMVECMQAMTQPAARSEKCACLMQGARQGKMHFDTNIYKTKKVRKSKTMMNQHIQSLCRHVSWSSR